MPLFHLLGSPQGSSHLVINTNSNRISFQSTVVRGGNAGFCLTGFPSSTFPFPLLRLFGKERSKAIKLELQVKSQVSDPAMTHKP